LRLALTLLAVILVSAGPGVHAVRVTTLDFRAAVRILTSEDTPPAVVLREGEEVVIRIPARPAGELLPPQVEAPLRGIRIEAEEQATIVRVSVPPEVPFETTQEAGMTTVVFGEALPADLRAVSPELYAQLFPTGALGRPPETDETNASKPSGVEGAFMIGRVALRPGVTASYVNADVFAADQPKPVRERYLQVGPAVSATTPLASGQLTADYEARLRFFATLPQVEKTSHLAQARLELPLGSRGTLRAAHRFTRAVLETTVVDPGQEYFFALAPYTFNQTLIGGRLDLGARLSAEGDATWTWTRFDAGATGFFSYDSRALRAGLGYDLGGDLRLVLSYLFERTPPAPERAIAETSAHDVVGTLSGTIGPLLDGSLSAGYRRQKNPQAAGRSASYDGMTLGGTLTRTLGHSSNLDLSLRRSTELSFFETNAYYVTNQASLAVTVSTPFETWTRGSVNWLRNDYPNEAAAVGEPRRDRILGWTVGIGRTISWRAWVRADYRREKRDSNLPGYDVRTSGFVIQGGIGSFGPGVARP
jgi:hypothetical protein